ncbi:MAG: hypothetical protein OXL40_02865 [Bacteroidota bacterium]|nr:hypothetical protein [Bacteroidota bacterium]
MSSLSAYRPRHWLLLIAGLSFVALATLLFLSIAAPPPGMVADLTTVTDPPTPWSLFALPIATMFFWLALGVSLIVYCVQWVATLISAIMTHHRSAST